MSAELAASVSVVAARSELTVEGILAAMKGEGDIQIFDAGAIESQDHVRLAFFHADKAFEEGRNLVRDRMLEVLLHAAASRQVADAVNRVGIKDPKRIVIGFGGGAKRKKMIFEKLKAKETKWRPVDKEAERKIIEKMTLLQLE